ncbi:MAG: NAD(P)-dependent alcohol dehydrogenase [Deltaproteobacteria bacterium]|nr:NAD(P)-dependent alcohol dehydrogenase [Deltaproteobacteria bacterium]
MKAAVIDRFGQAKNFRIAELPNPTPSACQYLLKVHASSINPVDWKIRNGMFRFLLWPKFPYVLGFDVCGEVVAAGVSAHRFKVGDWVFGMTPFMRAGAYAQYALADEKALALKPLSATPSEAAALPIAGLTALQGLRDRGRLKGGQDVLIIGAAGGVGHFAVQVAKVLGANVTAVCSQKNIEWVLTLGAQRAIDYQTTDIFADHRQFDLVFDTVAAHSFGCCKAILKKKGIYISTVPNVSSVFSQVTLPFYSLRRAKVLWLCRANDLDELAALMNAGKLKPHIQQTFKLEQIQLAHELSEQHHVKGKLVIAS